MNEFGKGDNDMKDTCKQFIDLFDIPNKDDAEIDSFLNELVSSPKEYCKTHENYADRCMDESSSDSDIIWIGILDYLIEKEVIVELDYACEAGDFIYGMDGINQAGIYSFDEEDFDDDESIVDWFDMIERKGNPQYCIAGYCIDSDSYCVFITKRTTRTEMNELARKMGQKISYAKDM